MGDLAPWVLVSVGVLAAIPLLTAIYQFLLVGFHAWRNHYGRCGPVLPRTAIVVPAWNEALVLETSIDQLMKLDYPAECLRVYVVDDASTDDTPALLARKAAQYPGAVFHLRRERGGEGKAHTLNHGLATVLADDWMQALLIMDADVVFTPESLRRMVRHLADPNVGAVTAYIKEGSRPGTSLNRFVAFEYVTAQAAARRAQNVIGAVACLAGGAQLHSRENLEAIGGRIDTSSLAEDTITTFSTQLIGRKVVFEPNATVWAEEPSDIAALWKQRLRWARGNVQVTRRYRDVWFRRARGGRLGGFSFGLFWFTLLLLPLFMIVSSIALVSLYFIDASLAHDVFRLFWAITAVNFVFTTTFALLLDPATAKRCWRQALMFPGAMSLAFIVYACAPHLCDRIGNAIADAFGWQVDGSQLEVLVLVSYVWISACMIGAWSLKALDAKGWHRTSRLLLYLVGYGSILSAVTFTAYVHELRGKAQHWDKTEKSGAVALR